MWRTFIPAVLALGLFVWAPQLSAQQDFVPAGTLLRCTLDEPHLSPRNADVGDPVLCKLSGVQRIGSVAFPRGSYLVGHIEAQKKLGNFGAHGRMKLVFDRIAWPNGAVDANSKVIAVKNYVVDHDGTIVGGWLNDPVLRGETPVTVRLMDDVEVPAMLVSYGAGWHFFGESNRR
jgi:hypothetical protein